MHESCIMQMRRSYRFQMCCTMLDSLRSSISTIADTYFERYNILALQHLQDCIIWRSLSTSIACSIPLYLQSESQSLFRDILFICESFFSLLPFLIHCPCRLSPFKQITKLLQDYISNGRL